MLDVSPMPQMAPMNWILLYLFFCVSWKMMFMKTFFIYE